MMAAPAWLEAVGREWVPRSGQTRYYVDGWQEHVPLSKAKGSRVKVWIGAHDLEIHVDHCDSTADEDAVRKAVRGMIEEAREETAASLPVIDTPADLHREVNATFERLCALYSATEPGTAKQALDIIVRAYEDAMPLLEGGME